VEAIAADQALFQKGSHTFVAVWYPAGVLAAGVLGVVGALIGNGYGIDV
jgi:hypothetical protein